MRSDYTVTQGENGTYVITDTNVSDGNDGRDTVSSIELFEFGDGTIFTLAQLLDPGNPGDPGDPGDPSDRGDPGDPGDPSDPSNPGDPNNTAPVNVRLNGQTSVSAPENSVFAAALSATDADGDALTFSFASGGNAGGMFVIDNTTKQLRLAPGKTLDFETAQSLTVYVKASDGHGGVSATQALTVTVTDVAEIPPGQILIGTSKANTLVGAGGNDRLYGKGGKDMLIGGAGQDTFVFDTKPNKKTNLDRISDYSVADDTIWLENRVFKKLGKSGSEVSPAALKKAFFKMGKAKDKNDYVVYNKKTGVLSYDADGSNAGKAVEIAKLARNLKLTQDDFFII
ncbi:cadherin domain-containing protein [Microvirga aerophila]|uniref:Cadherin domain-containing protein n=1 Tax=Microvirga aerophila TaxID=670291 RepID=A0A512BMD8_9HYPH|nr:cadherin domain-containing protein [Microvirga aerophila]GEO13122.1 hypothetical protein MAE02_08180 [Microvirga aerophila]